MKRILHILSSLERSGMEKMLLSSSEEWARLGYACDVVASAQTAGPLASEMRAAGYDVHHIPFRSRLPYLPRLGFLIDFYKLCRSGYDVVHIHTEAAAPVFAFVAKLAGVPVVVLTPHNTFYFTGILRLRKIVERFLIRFIGGRYGMISDGVLKCEWRNFRNPGVRTWNWIDNALFRPPSPSERDASRRNLNCEPNQFVIVSVGNCNDVKNHAEILRAIPMLPPSVDALYLHVGNDADGQSEKDLAGDLRIQQKVRFCGSQEGVREYLWAADVFVMPSLREGLGLAAIEAIACATPAVLANIEGLRDVAAVTESTVLTTTGTQSIASGLAQVAAMPMEERKRRALADSERVRQRFSTESGVRSIVDGLYTTAPKIVWFGRERTAH